MDDNLGEWVTTATAAERTNYSSAYIRVLARRGKVKAKKVGRDWLVWLPHVLAYKRRMDNLGPQKHNPWRAKGRVKE